MKKILGKKLMANLTFLIMLIGTVVFTFGFGSILYLARQEVQRETDQKISQAVTLVQTYIDGQLQRVEDVAVTLLSTKFGGTHRSEDGQLFVGIDPAKFTIPSEKEVFGLLENLINSNPHVCGIAIGFEPFIYPKTNGKYGFAAYVTNISGKNECLRLGEIHDYRQKEWYRTAAESGQPGWSNPFKETSQGKVITCYNIPLYGTGKRLIGVLAIDIDTDAFRQKCSEVTPFPSAEVSLADRQFHFIAHPNESYILKGIEEVGRYSGYMADDSMRIKILNHESGNYLINKGTDREAVFYFAPIKRTGWTISIECPRKVIFGKVEAMKRSINIIAAICMLFMIFCFILIFRKMQAVTLSKAGIERDLYIASAIQKDMIPKLYPAFPDRKELDIYGILNPAKTIGGDLYDYFIKDSKLFFCIGDVSGKGIPASLLMVVIRALFRNVSNHTDNPSEIISSMNNAIADGNTHNMFCTMFLGVLDLKTGHLDYCNAGHNAPIIRRIDQGISPRVFYSNPKANIAVGAFSDFNFEKESTLLLPGEAIFLYTDGVTEAENKEKQVFGDEALLLSLANARRNNSSTAKDFIDAVYSDVKKYAKGTEQSDDITMLVVEFKEKMVIESSDGSHLHLKNNIDDVPTLAQWIGMVAEERGLTEQQVFKLNLALEEAVVNVMKYAYPDQENMPVDIYQTAKDGEITFVIDDSGIEFDPTKKDNPDITLGAEERSLGGLGILLVKQIMDEVYYERADGHNRLTLKMNLKNEDI